MDGFLFAPTLGTALGCGPSDGALGKALDVRWCWRAVMLRQLP
jgi:hypothetical protein